MELRPTNPSPGFPSKRLEENTANRTGRSQTGQCADTVSNTCSRRRIFQNSPYLQQLLKPQQLISGNLGLKIDSATSRSCHISSLLPLPQPPMKRDVALPLSHLFPLKKIHFPTPLFVARASALKPSSGHHIFCRHLPTPGAEFWVAVSLAF